MHAGTHRLMFALVAVVGSLTLAPRVQAEDTDPAALAAAMANVPTTLEKGLHVSERTGKPISAKFEIEDGKLQLSIYTMTSDTYTEVLVAPNTGSVLSTEKITDADDLKSATAQRAAIEKASVSLTAATEQAVRQNNGSRAVSIFPELKGSQPTATVTLLRDGRLTTVSEKLD